MRVGRFHLVATGLLISTIVVAAAVIASEAPATDPDLDLWKEAARFFSPLPAAAPTADNPITAAKVELGKTLYFEPRLSKDGTISCNSCHSLATFGVDRQPTSPGDAGDRGDRNSPTVLNAALHVAQFWDGRAEDVEAQAGMPITNPIEMAIPSEEFLVERLAAFPEYRERFAAAFPMDDPPLSYRNIARALAAFERTLITPSRFDDYLRGDRGALTVAEKEGMRTFIDYGCTSCHNGVSIGAQTFRKFGLNDDYWHRTKSPKVDPGRFKVTGDEEDLYVFKVASLRNVAETYPYFHDGSVTRLEDAVQTMAELQVGLTPEPVQVENLVAFLKSLTGRVPEEAMTPPATVESTGP